jgi:hypothetical protein
MTSITTSKRQTFFIAQKVAQNLVTRAKGAIVNIGSMWANQDVAPAPRRVSNELTMAVDLEIMSSRDSRSRVALWSGVMQKVSTNANLKRRCTRFGKARIPRELIDFKPSSPWAGALDGLPRHAL